MATAAVSANRDVLLALAGVFILLPAFAIMVFLPEPEISAKTTAEELMALYSAYLGKTWPYMLAMSGLHLIGTLAMVALITDPHRPTVAQALRIALGRMVTAVVAMVMLLFVLGFIAGLPLNLAALGDSANLAFVGMAISLALLLYGLARALPLMPVIVVERQLNPVLALRRAITLSRGNGGRLLGFYALIFLAFLIVRQLFLAGLTITIELLLGAQGGTLVLALAASSIDAVMSVYMAAVLAAIHRQLTGDYSFQPQ